MPSDGRRRARAGIEIDVSDGRGRRVAGGLSRWLADVAPRRVRGTVHVAVVADRQVRALNRRYRGIDRPTDVLSFPADEQPSGGGFQPTPGQVRFLGDIVIARGVARRQAREAGHGERTELRVLALHGLLHLLGYDHDDEGDRGAMARIERRLRRRGGLREGLIERS